MAGICLGVFFISLFFFGCLYMIGMLPYKEFLMKFNNRGCYNCKWSKSSNISSIYDRCSCPTIRNLDSITGEYKTFCNFNVGTAACKWEKK